MRFNRIKVALTKRKAYLQNYGFDNFGIAHNNFYNIIDEYKEDKLIREMDFSKYESIKVFCNEKNSKVEPISNFMMI